MVVVRIVPPPDRDRGAYTEAEEQMAMMEMVTVCWTMEWMVMSATAPAPFGHTSTTKIASAAYASSPTTSASHLSEDGRNRSEQQED